MNDDELAYLAGSMFGAGSDTVIIDSTFRESAFSPLTQTAAAISIAIMAAALFPDAQKWVQDEIDSVIGKDRRKCNPLPLFPISWRHSPLIR